MDETHVVLVSQDGEKFIVELDKEHYVIIEDKKTRIYVTLDLQNENILNLSKCLKSSVINWSNLLKHYSKQNNMNIFQNFKTNKKENMFSISFVKDDIGREQANKLKEIIENFVDNEEILSDYIKKYGDEIKLY